MAVSGPISQFAGETTAGVEGGELKVRGELKARRGLYLLRALSLPVRHPVSANSANWRSCSVRHHFHPYKG